MKFPSNAQWYRYTQRKHINLPLQMHNMADVIISLESLKYVKNRNPIDYNDTSPNADLITMQIFLAGGYEDLPPAIVYYEKLREYINQNSRQYCKNNV